MGDWRLHMTPTSGFAALTQMPWSVRKACSRSVNRERREENRQATDDTFCGRVRGGEVKMYEVMRM